MACPGRHSENSPFEAIRENRTTKEMKRAPFVLIILLLVTPRLWAGEIKPVQPGPKDRCPVCGMFVAKHPDFLAQIVYTDGSRAFFDGVKDMMKYYFNLKNYSPHKTPSDMVSIYVTDYDRLEFIDGRRAFYIAGSDIYGPMGRELIPFEKENDAEAFMKDHRGKSLMTFKDVILFLGVQAVQNITDLALGPVTAAVPPPTPPPKQVLAAKEPPAPAKAVAVEKISLASKKLGLKLVGTVVADDANQSQAVIESSKNREQKAFREGDQIGKVRIKKIQRNKVIITTEEGDKLLTLDPERFAKNDRASSLPPGTVDSQSSPLEQGLDRQSQIRPVELGLTREFVTRFLGDPDEFLQNMEISPYTEDDRPAGFQITGITPNNPLGKMGLLDGDVIMAINQEAITSPQQAADFLRKLMEGGKIEIRVNRNRSRRLVRLNIK